ncbi:hypothetical protein [Hungatella sp.]|nr:hypothetical protein [Hungatella sp.]
MGRENSEETVFPDLCGQPGLVLCGKSPEAYARFKMEQDGSVFAYC